MIKLLAIATLATVTVTGAIAPAEAGPIRDLIATLSGTDLGSGR